MVITRSGRKAKTTLSRTDPLSIVPEAILEEAKKGLTKTRKVPSKPNAREYATSEDEDSRSLSTDVDALVTQESPIKSRCLHGAFATQDIVEEASPKTMKIESDAVHTAHTSVQTSDAVPKSKRNDPPQAHLKETTGSALTNLIPGYLAPRKLDTSALDKYRPHEGIAELRRRAERTDPSTAKFVLDAAEPHVQVMKKKSNGFLPTNYATMYSSFKTGNKRLPDSSAGAGWFGMEPTPMTDQLKTDLAVIRNRNYLDPKRFYKSAESTKGKILQLGTVIEGSAEFYSARLTKKQRRANLTEEIMADPAAASYTKNKYRTMQQTKSEKSRKKISKRGSRGF